jgi:acylphosphatase
MVQGAEKAVNALLRRARRGPRFARVERVEVAPGAGAHAGFAIRD